MSEFLDSILRIWRYAATALQAKRGAVPTVPTRRNANASKRVTPTNDPRAWEPLAQATACALLVLLAVFLVAAGV